VTLTYDPSSPKGKQHIYEPKYICEQNSINFSPLAVAYMAISIGDGICFPNVAFFRIAEVDTSEPMFTKI